MTALAIFTAERRQLRALAYRMLGTLSDTEDVLQDAYLRWHALANADGLDSIAQPSAYLRRIVTRLCLDRLRAARARRDSYPGPWLPEPVTDAASLAADSASELAEDISFALMLALERLTPPERAAFLLHDVFEQSFADIATILACSEANCRQLAARARQHIVQSRPRFAPRQDQGQALATAFMAASATGDLAALRSMLAQDAALYSDGGGIRIAALNVVRGADRVARLVDGLVRKMAQVPAVQAATLNGLPGFILSQGPGEVETLAFDIQDGLIAAIYLVRNPQKLGGIAAAAQF